MAHPACVARRSPEPAEREMAAALWNSCSMLRPVAITRRGQTGNASGAQAKGVVSVRSAYGSRDGDAGHPRPEGVAAEALEAGLADFGPL